MTSESRNARSPDHLRFALLPPDEQQATLRRLFALGWRDQAIINLTGIPPERVRTARSQEQVGA